MATDDLQSLLAKFVRTNANVADIQWGQKDEPTLTVQSLLKRI